MPETRFPIRCLAPAVLLLAGSMLGGCSGGDFGRTREDFRNDDMHRWIGLEATSSVGIRPSQCDATNGHYSSSPMDFTLVQFMVQERLRADFTAVWSKP